MRDFFSEFFRDVGRTNRVIFIDDEGTGQPRQYRIQPARVLAVLGAILGAVILVAISALAFTPLRELIPGYGTDEMRRDARLNAIRLAALEDSLRTQENYLTHLRNLVTGQIAFDDPDEAETEMAMVGEVEGAEPLLTPPRSQDWADHTQPAFEVDVLPIGATSVAVLDEVTERYLASVRFPTVPPLEGLLTRGFDPRIGHYGIDIATDEGSVVRSIGDGYVVFSDWTQEGGHALAIQHAKGYLSVYKHNQRLLKNIGDRVREREPIALSGNSGEITTGPHLHFELWQNGLSQDPHAYFLSL